MHSTTGLPSSFIAHLPSNTILFSTLFAIIVASRVVKFLHGLRSVNYLPGLRVPFQPYAIPGVFIPTSWWNPGQNFIWLSRKTLYQGGENFSVVPFVWGVPSIFTSNVEVIREILNDRRTNFQKTEDGIQVLGKFGGSLVASQNGDEWRRHRRVMGPAFNSKLYQLVWTETLRTYRQMEVAEGWSIRDTVDVPSVQTISTKMALLIIAKCGFGFPVDWSAPPTDPDGTMSIQEALRVVADSYIISLMAPDWVRSLPIPGFAKVRKAVHAFTAFMSREVEVRRQEVRDGSETSEERVDAFTMLVRANEQETGKRRLTDQEVIGNVFILLFAGHETTAHTMSTALMLLAVHDDIQSEVFEQIQEVVGDGRDVDLVYSDHEKLNKVLAVFFEALRLFPPAHLMIREATEDTVLNLPNPVGEEGSTPIAVQKGTNIILDMIGTQRNPRYFSDPEVFKPSRWYDVSGESEAFAGFSLGPRACIGRKFAVVEAVAFLTMLLRDWHVTPILEAGETPQVWKERFLSKPILGLTMSLRGAPVRLERRQTEK